MNQSTRSTMSIIHMHVLLTIYIIYSSCYRRVHNNHCFHLCPDFTDEFEVPVIRYIVPLVARTHRQGNACLSVRLVISCIPVKVGHSLVIVKHPRVVLKVIASDADLVV